MLVVRPFAFSVALLAAQCLFNGIADAAGCSSFSTRYNQDIEGVCVCTASDCDTVSNGYLTLGADEAGIYQTSKAGDRLAYTTVPIESGEDADADLVIDTTVRYQKIIGFGGAFTDAAAINVYQMDSDVQQRIVDAYFSETGLQYTIGRIPIASTDFSESIYSYNPVVDDFEMKHFSIDVDRAPNSNKLNFIKRAIQTTQAAQRDLTLFASQWGPPTWMTTENTTINAKIKGVAGEPYWKALALYYSKFIDAYKAEGINIWGLTTQNEPIKQTAPKYWQSLRFNTTDERDWIKKDLGPTLKQNHPDVKLIILDDQKDALVKWNAALNDPEARQYISGAGVHWYKNLDFVSKTAGNFADLTTWQNANPDLFLLATEACAGYLLEPIGTGAGVKLLQPDMVWRRGEIYARDIINDLANYATGWTDWNLVLNTKGGPTWVDNNVDAPILVDEVGKKEFYKQPMYYVMGHFSKFLPPQSVRVTLTASAAATSALANVDRVAFYTPQNQVALILQNRDATAKTVRVSLSFEVRHANITLPANSVQTIIVGERVRPTC